MYNNDLGAHAGVDASSAFEAQMPAEAPKNAANPGSRAQYERPGNVMAAFILLMIKV